MLRKLDGKIIGAFEQLLDASWYFKGKEDKAFETDFARYCGTKYRSAYEI